MGFFDKYDNCMIICTNSIGFETTSSTISFCLYELAKNPELQERAYNEIIRVLNNHGGEITYDSVAQMKYLENCIDGEFKFCIHSEVLL